MKKRRKVARYTYILCIYKSNWHICDNESRKREEKWIIATRVADVYTQVHQPVGGARRVGEVLPRGCGSLEARCTGELAPLNRSES